MQLLLLLLDQPGHLVTREQIVHAVWGDDVYVASDASINAAIRKIRRALRDDPDKPRFVQTVSGRGYRFIAAVAQAEAIDTTRDERSMTACAGKHGSRH